MPLISLLLLAAACSTDEYAELDEVLDPPSNDTGDFNIDEEIQEAEEKCEKFLSVDPSNTEAAYCTILVENENAITFLDDSFINDGLDHLLSIGMDTKEAAWNDYDSDGDLDLFLTTPNKSTLYINDNGQLQSLPDQFGIQDYGVGRTATWLESNLILATENGLRYYIYQGNDEFIESAALYGLADYDDISSLVVEDFDGDGLEDIFIEKTTGERRYFTQLADHTFISAEDDAFPTISGNTSSTDAISFYHGDQSLPSIYVGNWDGGNQCYINQQDGTFEDQAVDLGNRDAGQTTAALSIKFHKDMDDSLVLGRWEQSNLVYIAQKDIQGILERYVNISESLGLDTIGQTTDLGAVVDQNGVLIALVVIYVGGYSVYENQTYKMPLN